MMRSKKITVRLRAQPKVALWAAILMKIPFHWHPKWMVDLIVTKGISVYTEVVRDGDWEPEET